MTVSTTTCRKSYNCDGNQTEFPFDFKIFAEEDLQVILRDSEENEAILTLNTDYTVNAGPWETGGTVTTTDTYESGNTLVILRVLEPTQPLDYHEGDAFPAEIHESGLDRGVLLLQQALELLGRQLSLRKSSSYSDLTLPDPVADKFLAWKGDLSGIKNMEIRSEGDLAVTDFIKTLLDDVDAKEARQTLNLPLFGYMQRSQFTYNGGATPYTIKAKAAIYHVRDKLAFWTSELTTDAIDSPAAYTWYYLYLDYSEITEGTSITADELIWSDTEPSWNDSYMGWYNGDDRCIFAALTNVLSDNIEEFFHYGDFILYADGIIDLFNTDIDTAWTDVTLNIPAFCTKAQCKFTFSSVDNATSGMWRTNGQTGDTGHTYAKVGASGDDQSNTLTVITDSSQKIEIKHNASGDDTSNLTTDGWYFPVGM